MSELNNQIFEILLNIISVLVAISATYIIKWIKNKVDTEELKKIEEKLFIVQQIAMDAVRYAEQHGIDIEAKGEEKLQIACNWMSDKLKTEGIDISPNQIRGFIKAALRSIKDNFGEEWAKDFSEK